MSTEFSRRKFVTTGVAALCASSAFPLLSAAAPKVPLAFPVLLGGPSFSNTSDPEELALAHRKLGYSAAYCPFIPINEADKISAFRSAFEKHQVVFAEVGRWVNLLDPDSAKRAENLAKVTDGLALAEEMGARCCVDIAGSYDPTSWFGPHPDNFSRKHFDACVENARKIIDAVKPKRAKFCYEMMGWAHPHDVESSLKLIKAVDRRAFGAHLDPCNLINSPAKFYDTTTLLKECFDKLGKWIVSCHAKDLTWDVEMNLHFREVVPGKGTLDYRTYLKGLSQLPQQPPLMIEHMANAEEYAAGRDHILKVGKGAGVQFG